MYGPVNVSGTLGPLRAMLKSFMDNSGRVTCVMCHACTYVPAQYFQNNNTKKQTTTNVATHAPVRMTKHRAQVVAVLVLVLILTTHSIRCTFCRSFPLTFAYVHNRQIVHKSYSTYTRRHGTVVAVRRNCCTHTQQSSTQQRCRHHH